MTGDVDLARGTDGVKRYGISAIEAQHTQALERNRLAQQHRNARERHVERRRVRDQARQSGEQRVGVDHGQIPNPKSQVPNPQCLHPALGFGFWDLGVWDLRAQYNACPRMPVLAPALPGLTFNSAAVHTNSSTANCNGTSATRRSSHPVGAPFEVTWLGLARYRRKKGGCGRVRLVGRASRAGPLGPAGSS